MTAGQRSAPTPHGLRAVTGFLPLWLSGALVAVCAGGLLLGAAAPTRRSARVEGGVSPVDAGARDARDIRGQNSPNLARSPRNAALVALVNRVDTPRFSCSFHVSSDRGATWTERPLPMPASEEPKCFAPDVAFGADGMLYVLFVTLAGAGNVPHAVWLSSSPDGGRTVSPPRQVLGPRAFQVGVVADASVPGRLYLSWLQADQVVRLGFGSDGNPIQVARSDDGGVTWQAPTQVSSPSRRRVLAPRLVEGRGGELLVAFLDVGGDALDYQGAHEGLGGEPYQGRWTLVVARSADRGATWREAVVDDGVVPTTRFVALFPPSPSLTAGAGGGAAYVGYTDGRHGDADVMVWSSTDGGRRWARGARVNDTAAGDRTSQYLPQLAVAPGGRLDVVYYDRRNDPADVMNEVSLQSSTDGARSFSSRVRLSDRSFDSRIGFGAERGMPDLGSRLGLLSDRRRALALWTDTRAGTQASNKQDLARAVVVMSRAPAPVRVARRGRPLFVAAGIGGLLLLTAAAARSLRRRQGRGDG